MIFLIVKKSERKQIENIGKDILAICYIKIKIAPLILITNIMMAKINILMQYHMENFTILMVNIRPY